MRRLTVFQLLPALVNGGVERSTLDVAAALVAAGHRSVVVSAGGPLVATLQAEGSEHICLDIGRKSLLTLRHARSLRRLFDQVEPDIVHARSRLPAWLAWTALASRRVQKSHFVTSVHGLNSPGWYSSILTRGERVLCVSETVRQHVARHWPRTDPARIVVIEPGLDAARFAARVEPSKPNLATSEPVLLMPGRGTRLKGHATAITLLGQLHAAGCRARLRLLGTREAGREAYIVELEELARAQGVEAFLEILPPVADVATAYRQCDVVLQLSAKPEAYGRTVVEALCVGKPVIGWAHGGVGELLRKHFPQGQVPLGDHAALLATTLRLLADAPLIPPLLAQSLSAMQAQTLDVYESLAG